MSINLLPFVHYRFTDHAEFDWHDFKQTVRICTRAMDDIIDENLPNHPLKEQRENVAKWRNIGMGIMGLGSALIALGKKYGEPEAIHFAYAVMKEMLSTAIEESIELAKERGPFPGYSDKIWEASIIKNNVPEYIINKGKQYGLRNCSLLSIAPCGSISTMLGEKYGGEVSGGCEPFFAFSYTRTTKSLNGEQDKDYKIYVGLAKEYMEKYHTDELPDYFISSENIPWKKRIDMQAALQDACDTAISSTVNLPIGTTADEIEQLYLYAWEKGLKGITIFVSNCKRTAILSTSSPSKGADHDIEKERKFDYIKPISRKTMGTTQGMTFAKKTACGTLYITINKDADGNVVETFINTSKGGICQANVNAINRMVSCNLRAGVKVDEVIDQLKGISCPACLRSTSKGTKLDGISCPDILGKTLEEFKNISQNHIDKAIITEMTSQNKSTSDVAINDLNSQERCPECGEPLHHIGGCVECSNCFYSKCE